MQKSHTRTSRVLQAIQNTLLGRDSSTDSNGDETETPSPKSVPSSLHNSAGIQTVHDQDRSKETSELDRSLKHSSSSSRRPFASTYNNTYFSQYQPDHGVLTIGINNTDILYLTPFEAETLLSHLEEFIKSEIENG